MEFALVFMLWYFWAFCAACAFFGLIGLRSWISDEIKVRKVMRITGMPRRVAQRNVGRPLPLFPYKG